MNLQFPQQLIDLIEQFNKSDNALTSYALASAIRAELMRYVNTLDTSILPLLEKAMVKNILDK